MTTATTAARERALILTSDEVRAALAGAKTQARRVLRLSRHGDGHKTDLTGARPELRNAWPFLRLANGHEFGPVRSPFGLPGDNLWVRESWRGNPVISFGGGGTCILLKYRADNATRENRGDFNLSPHAEAILREEVQLRE